MTFKYAKKLQTPAKWEMNHSPSVMHISKETYKKEKLLNVTENITRHAQIVQSFFVSAKKCSKKKKLKKIIKNYFNKIRKLNLKEKLIKI